MMKFFYLIFLIFFLASCQSAKDALTLKKKNSSDEFLVEKKSPLVLPPDYGELPIPNEIGDKKISKDENETKDLSSNSEIKINEIVEKSEPSSLEKLVLEKIK